MHALYICPSRHGLALFARSRSSSHGSKMNAYIQRRLSHALTRHARRAALIAHASGNQTTAETQPGGTSWGGPSTAVAVAVAVAVGPRQCNIKPLGARDASFDLRSFHSRAPPVSTIALFLRSYLCFDLTRTRSASRYNEEDKRTFFAQYLSACATATRTEIKRASKHNTLYPPSPR